MILFVLAALFFGADPEFEAATLKVVPNDRSFGPQGTPK
jgi:hypothetical protein